MTAIKERERFRSQSVKSCCEIGTQFGVSDVPEAQDEYDAYVGGVYRLLVSGASEDEIIEHLYRIESDTMGMPAADREGLRVVVRELTKLNVSL